MRGRSEGGLATPWTGRVWDCKQQPPRPPSSGFVLVVSSVIGQQFFIFFFFNLHYLIKFYLVNDLF